MNILVCVVKPSMAAAAVEADALLHKLLFTTYALILSKRPAELIARLRRKC